MPLTEIAVKEYTALLTQSGTGAPVPTILHNTLGNIIWTRQAEGAYKATLTLSFEPNKTFITYTQTTGGDFYTVYENESEIMFYTTQTGSAQDDLLNKTPIKIQVYNI